MELIPFSFEFENGPTSSHRPSFWKIWIGIINFFANVGRLFWRGLVAIGQFFLNLFKALIEWGMKIIEGICNVVMKAVEAIFKAILLLLILITFVIALVLVTAIVLLMGALIIGLSGGNGGFGFLYAEATINGATIRLEEQVISVYEPWLGFNIPTVQLVIIVDGDTIARLDFGFFGGTNEFIDEDTSTSISQGTPSKMGVQEEQYPSMSTFSNGGTAPRLHLDPNNPQTGKQNEELTFTVFYEDDQYPTPPQEIKIYFEGEGRDFNADMTFVKETTYQGEDVLEYSYILDCGERNWLDGDYSYQIKAKDSNGEEGNSIKVDFEIEFDWSAYWTWLPISLFTFGFLPLGLFVAASFVPQPFQTILLIAAIAAPLAFLITMIAILFSSAGSLTSIFQEDPSGIALAMSVMMIAVGVGMILGLFQVEISAGYILLISLISGLFYIAANFADMGSIEFTTYFIAIIATSLAGELGLSAAVIFFLGHLRWMGWGHLKFVAYSLLVYSIILLTFGIILLCNFQSF